MKQHLRNMKQYLPLAVAAALALAVIYATAVAPVPTMVIGGILAALVSVLVTVEYLVLVPLKNNPGAKRLVGLLVALDLLLTLVVIRYFFKGIPLSRELLVLLFWGLAASLTYLGWHIWKDQIEGARQYRRNHPEKESNL